MCCFRLSSEHASLRSGTATAGHTLRQQHGSPINDNRVQMRAPRHPLQRVRWHNMRVAVTVAPTLAIITMLAGYYFGTH